jgi:hypothetical protein
MFSIASFQLIVLCLLLKNAIMTVGKTLELHFIYLVTSNNSLLEQNDIDFIENSSSYKIIDIVQNEKDQYKSFDITGIGYMPNDRIYDNGALHCCLLLKLFVV